MATPGVCSFPRIQLKVVIVTDIHYKVTTYHHNPAAPYELSINGIPIMSNGKHHEINT